MLLLPYQYIISTNTIEEVKKGGQMGWGAQGTVPQLCFQEYGVYDVAFMKWHLFVIHYCILQGNIFKRYSNWLAFGYCISDDNSVTSEFAPVTCCDLEFRDFSF